MLRHVVARKAEVHHLVSGAERRLDQVREALGLLDALPPRKRIADHREAIAVRILRAVLAIAVAEAIARHVRRTRVREVVARVAARCHVAEPEAQAVLRGDQHHGGDGDEQDQAEDDRRMHDSSIPGGYNSRRVTTRTTPSLPRRLPGPSCSAAIDPRSVYARPARTNLRGTGALPRPVRPRAGHPAVRRDRSREMPHLERLGRLIATVGVPPDVVRSMADGVHGVALVVSQRAAAPPSPARARSIRIRTTRRTPSGWTASSCATTARRRAHRHRQLGDAGRGTPLDQEDLVYEALEDVRTWCPRPIRWRCGGCSSSRTTASVPRASARQWSTR